MTMDMDTHAVVSSSVFVRATGAHGVDSDSEDEVVGIAFGPVQNRSVTSGKGLALSAIYAFCLSHCLARKGLAVFNRYAHTAGPPKSRF